LPLAASRAIRSGVLRAIGVLALIGSCQAQPAPPVRLPQDSTRDLEPIRRDVPLTIDRNRLANQAPPDAANVVFRLESIRLEGNQALSTAALAPLWADLLHREISLVEVFDLAARISAAYRDAGYILSQALVPRQDISRSGATVQLRVVEGYVGHITFADDLRGVEHIRRLLAPITAERPLTLATLERRLLLLNDLPGTSARASLRAGQDEGTADMELVVERDLTAAALALHNRTTTAVGPIRIEATAERRALVGAFDREVLRWVGSGNDRLNLVAYDGDAPVGADGATVSWSGSASRSKPKTGVPFSFDTNSHALSVGAAYPLMRSRRTNLSVRGTLAGYNGSSNVLDGLQSSRERIRSLRLGLTFDLTDDAGGIDLVDVELDKGLGGLGASRRGDADLARLGSNPQFTKVVVYVARLQSLGGDWSLLAAATAQGSSDLLTSSEQFGLGGDVFLRAYDPSELLGDEGIAAKLELRRNVNWGAASATAYAFYEGGAVHLRSVDGPYVRESAGSGGLGVRIGARRIKAFLEVAQPIHRPTAHGNDLSARVFAGIAVDL